jgi:hypothetical protein
LLFFEGKQMRLTTRACIIAAISTLSACASVQPYQSSLSTFSQGVDDLGGAFSGAAGWQRTKDTNARIEEWSREVPPPQLATSKDCDNFPQKPDQIENSPCILSVAVAVPSTPEDAERIKFEKALTTAGKQVAALKAYADALVALASSSDSDTLTKNSASVNTSLTGLGSAVGNAEAADKTDAVSAANGAGFLNDISTAYLNYERFQALRDAVSSANPLIKQMVDNLAATFNTIGSERLNATYNRLTEVGNKGPKARWPVLDVDQHKSLSPDQFTTEATQLATLVGDVQGLRVINPEYAIDQLYIAHNALNTSLQGGDDTKSVSKAMANFLGSMQLLDTEFTSVSAKPVN